MARVFIKPTEQWIGRSDESEKLYDAENRRNGIIELCAKRWAFLMTSGGAGPIPFWEQAVPQALFDALSGFEQGVADIAAIAYLEKNGYTVTAPVPDVSEPPKPGDWHTCEACGHRLE